MLGPLRAQSGQAARLLGQARRWGGRSGMMNRLPAVGQRDPFRGTQAQDLLLLAWESVGLGTL